jgi:hypothetical protein
MNKVLKTNLIYGFYLFHIFMFCWFIFCHLQEQSWIHSPNALLIIAPNVGFKCTNCIFLVTNNMYIYCFISFISYVKSFSRHPCYCKGNMICCNYWHCLEMKYVCENVICKQHKLILGTCQVVSNVLWKYCNHWHTSIYLF